MAFASGTAFGFQERTMRRILWLTLIACIGLTNAHAQQLSDLRVGVFGGGSLVAASRTFKIDGDVFNTKYEIGPRIGFRATASLTDRVSVEGAYSFGRNNLRVTTMRAVPTMRLYDTRTHQFSGNVLYYFSGVGDEW